MTGKFKGLMAAVVLGATVFVGGAGVAAVPAGAKTTQSAECRDLQTKALLSFYRAIGYTDQVAEIDRKIQSVNAHMPEGWQKRSLLESLMVRKGNVLWQRQTAINNTNMYNKLAAAACR